MTDVSPVRTMACILVPITLIVTLLSGSALAAEEENRRKIVMFNNPPTQEVFKLLAGAGIPVLYNLSLINALAVQLPPSTLLDPALVLLQSLPDLQQVSDDVLTFVHDICPTTALSPISESYRWGPQQIKVPEVDKRWSEIKGSAAVTVAVLDTGIASHSELNDRTAPGYNALGGGQPADGHGHGTHMAGIIAANKNQQAIIGVAGMESGIKVAPVKVLDDTGAAYLSVVINGLEWLVNNYIPLVNMSFGFSFSKQSDGTPLLKAVQKVYEAGVIMVASAGNRCTAGGASDDGGGDECGPAASCSGPLTAVTAPAAYGSWVIAVGATAVDGQAAPYSLSGAVWAPGGEPASAAPDNGQILSTNTGGVYGLGYGTSQAAAHVTGAIALALQIHPGLSFAQVKNLLQQTSQSGGLIDVDNMIE